MASEKMVAATNRCRAGLPEQHRCTFPHSQRCAPGHLRHFSSNADNGANRSPPLPPAPCPPGPPRPPLRCAAADFWPPRLVGGTPSSPCFFGLAW